MGREFPKLVVILQEHHRSVATDTAEDFVHVAERGAFAVKFFENVGQRADFFQHTPIDIDLVREFHAQTFENFARLLGLIGKTRSQSA